MNQLNPQKNTDSAQWLQLFNQITNSSSYKFMYSDIDSYVSKVNKIMTHDLHHPKILLKKHEHKSMLNQLKINYSKLIDDLNMLNLHNLAMCTQYIFDKLIDCLQIYFSNLLTCVQSLNEQTTLNHKRYIYHSKCSQCQKNFQKSKVESLMGSMTLGNHLPNFKQIQTINKQLDQLSTNYEDIQLTLMIDQILQRKQTILNCKNPRINNIYDEIAQYLENIPQATLNFSKQNFQNNQGTSQFQICNFSEQLQQNFGQMLRNPIKKLIKRILDYAKSIYCKKKQSQTVSTQTLLIKDQQNIKMLLKNNDGLKKQLQLLKKIKRENQKDMVKLLDSQEKNNIKIHELMTQNSFLHQKHEKVQTQLISTKLKLQVTENSKKQMGQKLVRDYTNERSHFLRTIRELQLRIESTDLQLRRLKKQTQGNMISQSIETNNLQLLHAQIQTDQKMINIQGDIRSSMAAYSSRKNFVSKFANMTKKQDNNDNLNGIQNQQTPQHNGGLYEQLTEQDSNRNYINRKKLKKSSIIQGQNQFYAKKSPQKSQNEQNSYNHTKLQKRVKKKQSIVQKLDLYQQQQKIQKQHGNCNNDILKSIFLRGQIKKLTQTNKTIKQTEFQSFNSENSLRFQSKLNSLKGSKQKDRETCSRQSDYKRMALTGNLNRLKVKPQSSRMFISKAHCSPYINSNSQIYPSSPTHWLDLIQLKSTQRQNQYINQQKKMQENTEKIRFVSLLMHKYSKLKQTGILNKINEIVAYEQLQESPQNHNSNQKKLKQMNYVQQKKIVSRKDKNKYKSMTPECFSKVTNKLSYIRQKQKIQVFTRKQVDLLFDSLENANKYQLNTDIWSCLEKSIMLDLSLMNLCNNVEIFFTQVQKNQHLFYLECYQFLKTPKTYFETRLIRENKNGLRVRHKKNNSNVEKKDKASQQEKQKSPHQLRDLVHRILRYHKVAHKKCKHVQQFLSLLGLKMTQV